MFFGVFRSGVLYRKKKSLFIRGWNGDIMGIHYELVMKAIMKVVVMFML